MELKMFEIRAKLVSVKQKVLRSIRGLGKEDFNISSPTSAFAFAPYACAHQDLKPPKTFNLQAYILAKQHIHEVECQKAMSISLSRHERWKAGGPL